MHIHLRERNLDTRIIQCILAIFPNAPQAFPVVLALKPASYDQVDGGVAQLVYKDTHFPCLVYSLVLPQYIQKHFPCGTDIRLIGDPDIHICSAGGFAGYVDQRIVR